MQNKTFLVDIHFLSENDFSVKMVTRLSDDRVLFRGDKVFSLTSRKDFPKELWVFVSSLSHLGFEDIELHINED